MTNNKIIIKLSSVSKKTLDLYKIFFLSCLDVKSFSIKTFDLPKKTGILTLLKSPHVNKRFKESFIHTEHRSLIHISSKNSGVCFFSCYTNILINKPKCISLQLTFRKNG